MTLLIACLLLYIVGAPWWGYLGAAVLWVFHVYFIIYAKH